MTICLEFPLVAVDVILGLVSDSPSMRAVTMRSTLTILTAAAVFVLAIPLSVSAQYQWAPAAAGQQPMAQPAAYGYWVPVMTYDTSPTGYALHLADDESPKPAVDSDSTACASRGCCDAKGGCDGRGNGCNCLRCRHSRLFDQGFASLEFMSWYNKGIHLPPLVTTSPQGTPQVQAGVLPGATIVAGNQDIDSDRQIGGRLTFGWWLDDCRNLAVGAKLYGVEGGAVRFGQSSNGDPIIGIPFFNADPLVNAEDALLVAFPGLSTGSVNITAANDVLGTEVYGRSLMDEGRDYRLDLIGGYQFNRIDSDLAVSSQIVQGATTFFFNDVFDVENTFNAGTLGLYGEAYWDLWTFSAMGKIGIGNMHQQIAISGNNTVVAGGTVTTPGGLFAQPTNIGTFDRNLLVWSPEVNFKMSYAITRCVSVTVGYSFLYWTRVAFAGDQVDRAVNDTQLVGGALVGPARPAFDFRDTDFWVQTVDLGVSWNF